MGDITSDWTIVDIKRYARSLNIPATGNRNTLIRRITDLEQTKYGKLNVRELQELLTDRSLARYGPKHVLLNRLKEDDRIDVSPKRELSIRTNISLQTILTGIADADREILLKLDDNYLYKVCSLNIYSERLCNGFFWNRRIQHIYGVDLSNYKEKNITYKELYKILRKHKGDTNEELAEASRHGYLPLVKHIIEESDTISIDEALSWASKYGQLAVVKYLINAGASLTAENNEPLILAANEGQSQIVIYLIETGKYSIDARNDALKAAAEYDNLNIVKYLIENTKYNNQGIGRALIRASMFGNLNIIKYLMGIWRKIKSTYAAVVFSAAKYGHLSVVQYFIEKQGVNAQTIIDYILYTASSGGSLGVVKYVIETAGADVNASEGRALETAATHGHLHIVKYLIEKGGADIHAGEDIVMLLHEYEYPEIVKYLKNII